MPINSNLVPIQTVTVGSGGSNSISFTSIPQIYTDLMIQLSVRSSSASGDSNCFMYFNGVTATSYTTRRLLGSGSTPSNDGFSSYPWIQIADKIPNATFTTSTFASMFIYIPNYTKSVEKIVTIDFVSENNTSSAQSGIVAGLFNSTNPITQIDIDGTDNFVQYSKATLYGATSSATGAKATGGSISEDNTYWYHTFTTSDTFTPNVNLTNVDYLRV